MKIFIIVLLTILMSCHSAVWPPIEVDPVTGEKVEIEKVEEGEVVAATEFWVAVTWISSFLIICTIYDNFQLSNKR